VQEVIAKDDPELAENELIFPSPEVLDRAFIFRELEPEEEQEIDEAFQAAVGA
jgi:spermidine/putrescine transport system substrate-binding protein